MVDGSYLNACLNYKMSLGPYGARQVVDGCTGTINIFIEDNFLISSSLSIARITYIICGDSCNNPRSCISAYRVVPCIWEMMDLENSTTNPPIMNPSNLWLSEYLVYFAILSSDSASFSRAVWYCVMKQVLGPILLNSVVAFPNLEFHFLIGNFLH